MLLLPKFRTNGEDKEDVQMERKMSSLWSINAELEKVA